MKIMRIAPDIILPTRATEGAGAFDIYMPEEGYCDGFVSKHRLGFATAIPENHVALILPRSGAGAKGSVELNNTCGVIDSDYRGEWMAFIRTKDRSVFHWEKDARILQFLVVPIAQIALEEVTSLDTTSRGTGGFGSTGN